MEKKVLYTPVLLLCFNRPEQTRQVFETIRSVKPQKLYVAVDAPREGRADDVENSKKVKEIVTNVDWECETHYLFQEKNLGCSKSGVTAWTSDSEMYKISASGGIAAQMYKETLEKGWYIVGCEWNEDIEATSFRDYF